MRSDAQIQASRANGARSHGPVTDEGKRRSAANSLKHGLLAAILVLDNEDRDIFDELHSRLIADVCPLNEFESAIVQEMAAAYWRLQRSWAIERQYLQDGVDSQNAGSELQRLANSYGQASTVGRLAQIYRNESRLNMILQRCLNKLAKSRAILQNEPNLDLPNEPKPEEPRC